MLPCLTLLLLVGLPACTRAEDKELVLSTESVPWLTLILQEGAIARIQFQIQEAKRSTGKEFYGLMGKRARGYQQGQIA
ncbi:tachykinin-4 isoform X2 [Erinaceus europaeus]|uniref:Tachykinin-4 isoform X2 n=1 Tax=Erinaceus europaeus TaxID=9365 RepID=A0ABM3YBH2_ERIEU|nr:tachykinin-4 isoform X2 [Erinaceus europaeus]